MLFPKFKNPPPGGCPYDLSVELLRRDSEHNPREEDQSKEVATLKSGPSRSMLPNTVAALGFEIP